MQRNVKAGGASKKEGKEKKRNRGEEKTYAKPKRSASRREYRKRI